MRLTKPMNLELNAKLIYEIELDYNSRYELIPLLEGLKHIYYNCDEVLDLILSDLTKNKSTKKGRKGMDPWRLLCLFVLRQNGKVDYAKLEHISKYDSKVREFFQIKQFEKFEPDEKTINKNILKLKSKTIDKINELFTKYLIEKNYINAEKVRGDSFVCKTNVHFSTDNSLIYDCGKTMIRLSVAVNELGWRKKDYWRIELKKIHLRINKIRKSRKRKDKKKYELKKEYKRLLGILRKIKKKSLKNLLTAKYYYQIKTNQISIEEMPKKYAYLIQLHLITEQVIDITYRRNINDEKVPHSDKIYSIYETHTELINRGKFPVSIEFGHKIMLNQDKNGFILNYKIMNKGETDEKVILPMLKDLKGNYGLKINIGSYDKGFYFKECYEDLKPYLDEVVIAKKGKPTKESKEREGKELFKKNFMWRAGIESLISSLVRGNGLGLCPDKGLENYKKYVAGCILARNLQTLGTILLKAKKKKAKKIA